MPTIRCKCGGRLTVSPKAFGLPARCPSCGSVVRAVAPWGPLEEGDKEFAARLVIMTGPQRIGEQIVLGGPGPVEVGKQKGKAIVLTGELVSRFHARFVKRSEVWHIEDQGSTNGSGVNGQRIERAALRHGDRVRIGDYEFLFLAHVEAAANEDASSEAGAAKTMPAAMMPWPPQTKAGPAGDEDGAEPSPRGAMIKTAIRWGGPILLVLAFLVFFWLRTGPAFVYTPGSLVKQQPIQTPPKDGKPWQFLGRPITPLADITLDAMVLGKQSYDDPLAAVAKWNLVLGWGAMSDPKLVADITIAQEARGLQMEFKAAPAVPLETLKAQLTVAIIIPASDAVLGQIERLYVHQVVTLKGKLVSAELADGQRVTSNLKRGQPYAGNPDVLWIESIIVHAPAATAPASKSKGP